MGAVSAVDINKILEKAKYASAVFSQLDQEQTDRIVRAVYEAGFNNRIKLAKQSFEETGRGRWEDKVIKNVVATQLVYENIKDLKTVGVISDDTKSGITEIAQPIGPVLALTPLTNPVATVMFKTLIALKTRNPIIISPHPKAVACSIEAARICYEAALKEDAPEDCIKWIDAPSLDLVQAFAGHKDLALVLATGSANLVKAVRGAQTPSIGVNFGNVPVFVEKSADPAFVVEQILISKTFDNGMVCSSEQAIVAEKTISDKVIEELKQQNCHFLSKEEIKAVEKIAIDPSGGMNDGIVGRSALDIAKMAGIEVPEETKVLIAPLKGVGPDHPLSSEILAPILAFYTASNFEYAVKLCMDLNYHGGIGHTASLFSNDEEKIMEFASMMNAGRILVNTPSSQGAVGALYNTLDPSFTLGCGTAGKNITTDNITAKHLLNIQRIARRRISGRLEHFDQNQYFDQTLDAKEIEKKFNLNY